MTCRGPSVLIMGVSGCGKTTVAAGVAERLGWRLLEGDAFHPSANVTKMAAGIPLTDDDRWPWLHAIALEASRPGSCVIACSALKRAYRAVLVPGVLVYLQGAQPLIAARLAARTGHFMPTSLLDSQFATLEPPGPEENPLVVPIDAPPGVLIAAVIAGLKERLP